MQRSLTLVVAAVLLGGLPLTVCTGEPVPAVEAVAGPDVAAPLTFPELRTLFAHPATSTTVDDLVEASDVVVLGTYGERQPAPTVVDLLAGDGAGLVGLPLTRWTFMVDEALLGTGVAAGADLSVTQLEPAEGLVEGASSLTETGTRAVLFLEEYAPGQYVVTGLGDGALVLTVQRAPGGEPASADSGGPLVEGLDDLRFRLGEASAR